jgi:hypothetical protein
MKIVVDAEGKQAVEGLCQFALWANRIGNLVGVTDMLAHMTVEVDNGDCASDSNDDGQSATESCDKISGS